MARVIVCTNATTKSGSRHDSPWDDQPSPSCDLEETPTLQKQQTEQLLDDSNQDINNYIMQERRQALQTIEQDVENVQETMVLLAQHVKTQSEDLDVIDNLIGHVADDTSSTVKNLESAEGYATRYRRRIWGLVIGTAAVVGTGVGLALAYANASSPKINVNVEPSNNPKK